MQGMAIEKSIVGIEQRMKIGEGEPPDAHHPLFIICIHANKFVVIFEFGG